MVGRRGAALHARTPTARSRGRRPVPAGSRALQAGLPTRPDLRREPGRGDDPHPRRDRARARDPRRLEPEAGVGRREHARHPRAHRCGDRAGGDGPGRSERALVPGCDPPRSVQRAGEAEPRASLPSELVHDLGPWTRAAAALGPRRGECVGAGTRVLMHLHFLAPTAALVALVGLVPLAVVLLVDRRNARARALLGLPEPRQRERLTLPFAVVLLSAVLGLAAAQPVWRTERPRVARLDAEAFVAVDTSRSMLASSTADSAPRLDRARRIALAIRSAIPDVPTGLGTFTDRPLPLLLPTPDRDAFAAAVHRSLAIEQPPGLQNSITISSFDAVAPFPLEGYFGPGKTKRLLVIITDAESTTFNYSGVKKSFEARPRTAVVLVRIGGSGERVYGTDGLPESDYVPPPATGSTLKAFLDATRG